MTARVARLGGRPPNKFAADSSSLRRICFYGLDSSYFDSAVGSGCFLCIHRTEAGSTERYARSFSALYRRWLIFDLSLVTDAKTISGLSYALADPRSKRLTSSIASKTMRSSGAPA
jgi:hypothetical protein